MPKTPDESARKLRMRVEATITSGSGIPSNTPPLEETELLHELRVHQLELEVQNEELRLAQSELVAERARYADLYNRAPVGYCTISEQGLILESNHTASTMLGVVQGTLVTQPITRFILPEDQDIFYLYRMQLFKTGGSQACELRMVKQDGSELWVWVEAALVQDTDGVSTCRVVLSDITNHKRSEKALLRSEERAKKSMDSLIEGCQIIGYDWRYVYLNDSAAQHGRKPKDAFIGRTMMEEYPGFEETETFYFLKKSMEKRVSQRFENEFVYQDGSKGWFELSVQPVEEGIFILSNDISSRKLAEEEKARLESQLHQAQKMESVGSLAGGVAHDFNNKLCVILGCAYLASVGSDPDKLQHYLEEIREAAEQSADLTRQLLAFARKQTIIPKVLNLNEVVTKILKMLRRLIGEDIILAWQPAPDLWHIKVDPSQIDQILANLCVNARDSITGTGTITIETENCTIYADYCAHYVDVVPGDYVRLVVSDTGCGMTHETLERIFEPFFTTKEMGKGTGLGLATVFGIVKQNNGFISVHSKPGGGTTFTISLPRYVDTSEQTAEEGVETPVPRGVGTILLVEDEYAILSMTTTILTNLGYTVLSASSPTEAIGLVKEHTGEICLLITDVIMPEMNGKDLAFKLQSLHPHLKCLFMSGYTADIIARHGVLDEGVNFIQKPFSMSDLAAKVGEVLGD